MNEHDKQNTEEHKHEKYDKDSERVREFKSWRMPAGRESEDGAWQAYRQSLEKGIRCDADKEIVGERAFRFEEKHIQLKVDCDVPDARIYISRDRELKDLKKIQDRADSYQITDKDKEKLDLWIKSKERKTAKEESKDGKELKHRDYFIPLDAKTEKELGLDQKEPKADWKERAQSKLRSLLKRDKDKDIKHFDDTKERDYETR